jgi:membrane-bound ClpP family serine protease
VGLFSVQLHPEHGPAAAHRVKTLPNRLRRAAVAAINDARIVAILLVLAALALGLEMAASFHLL